MNEKTVNINNFIGVYDNYITKEECNRAIKLFEDQDKFNNTLNRIDFEKAPVTLKQDKQYFARSSNIDVWWEELKPMMFNFDLALRHYMQNTGAVETYGNIPFHFTTLKIQKTLPAEGYHVWHVEHGGETEFLHQSVRVKPKTGRIVIWPAGFPYAHRGNPPLSGEKYILTSWMLVR